jgi:hemolysin III
VCFFLAVPAGVWVVMTASSPRARVGAIPYAVGLIALFGVSGLYHRGRWGQTWRRRMGQLDHATIFVMIAGSYTPLCLLVLDGPVAYALLALVWAGALAGGVLAWHHGRRTRFVRSGLYIAMGWAVAACAPQLVHQLGLAELVLILVGGVLFTAGAIALATRWPDPFPRVFGYHEVWHVFVVAAVVCHLIVISAIIRSPLSA